jgi:hypothetical protein
MRLGLHGPLVDADQEQSVIENLTPNTRLRIEVKRNPGGFEIEIAQCVGRHGARVISSRKFADAGSTWIALERLAQDELAKLGLGQP